MKAVVRVQSFTPFCRLSLTPCFSRVAAGWSGFSTVSTVFQWLKPLKRLGLAEVAANTPLKRGVNERSLGTDKNLKCSVVSQHTWGMTLVEMLVALGLSTMVLGGVMTLFTVSLKNFTGMGNYASLTSQSRQSMDTMSKDIRQATTVLSYSNTPAAKSLTLTNAFTGVAEVYSWDSNSCNLVCAKTGQNTRTNLTGCDSWDFSLFQRNPTNSWTFITTTNLGLCKLINMTWKCSRTLLGTKLNTEDLVTAEIVLRNKQ